MCCLASTLIGMALVFALKSTYDPNSRPATTAGVYCKFGWYIINGATTLVLSGGGAATDNTIFLLHGHPETFIARVGGLK